MEIYIINGPNLNLLGKREPEIYGSEPYESYLSILKDKYRDINLHYYQSNSEGYIIDKIHEIGFNTDGVVINAGAYSHSSYAIADAVQAVTATFVEVHISNLYKREAFRHKSVLTAYCDGIISGLGLQGYSLAIDYLVGKKL